VEEEPVVNDEEKYEKLIE